MSKQRRKVRENKAPVVNKNGYFSETTNSLQISFIGKDHWVGDEALILNEDASYPFSVITNSRVVVYEITIEDLMSHLSKDIVHSIKKN